MGSLCPLRKLDNELKNESFESFFGIVVPVPECLYSGRGN
jgi:hypothetical protein